MVLTGTKGMFQDRSHHGESNKGGEKLEVNNRERLIIREGGDTKIQVQEVERKRELRSEVTSPMLSHRHNDI